MNNAITPYVDPAIEDVKRLANLVLALRNEVFIDGQDYGTIPGTGDKPTLLLPGMEKLMRAMHLRPEYIERLVIRDYDRPLFHYEYECRLVEQDTNLCVSTAVGLATSHESKWRWRDSKRVCPNCGAACINRSKFPPKKNPNATPGWYCFAKQGGCGAEFAHDDPAIIEQTVGRIENPDIFDQVNTIAKIAQKRALASAIKGAANVSEFFTVDLDDLAPFQVSAPKSHVVDAVVTVEVPAKAWPDNERSAWGKALKARGWTTAQIYEALDVDALKDFNGTQADADALIARQEDIWTEEARQQADADYESEMRDAS